VPTLPEQRRVAAVLYHGQCYHHRAIDYIATCATSWLLPRGSILPTHLLRRGVAINFTSASGGIFQLLYTARAILKGGRSKGPDRSAKNQQHARQKRAKRPHAIHHDSRRVLCTDAKGRDMHNEADALRPPCCRESKNGKQNRFVARKPRYQGIIFLTCRNARLG
jgi:hypothetical protein